MSLINEALRRAKTAQQHAPAAADSSLQLRPMESTPPPKSAGIVLPAILAMAAIAGGVFWWQLHQNNSVAPEAKPVAAVAQAAAPSTPPRLVPAERPAALPATAAAPHETTVVTEKTPASDSAPAIEPARPAPPRLQAIVFNASRPSAIINGKTVFIGDRFKEFRVIAIDAESATLANATQTNVLTME